MTRPIRRWYLPLLYLYLILIILTGFMAFERKVSAFTSLGFYFRGTPPRVTQVEAGSNAELAGLLPDDTILSVEGQNATEDNLRDLLLKDREGATAAILRNPDRLTLFLQIPRGHVDLTYIAYSFTGFVFLIIGVVGYFKRKRRTGLIFLWITIFAFQLLVLQPAGKINDLLRTILGFQLLAQLLLPVSLFHFFLTFPRPLARKLDRLIPLLYTASLTLFAAMIDTLFLHRFFHLGDESIYSLNHTGTGWTIFLIMGSFVLFGVQWFKGGHPRNRRQLQWILLGVAIGVIPYLIFHILPSEGGIQTGMASWLFIPFLAFIPLTTTYAIWEYRIWDVGVVIREVLSYGVTLALGLFVYILLHQGLSLLPERFIPSTFFFLFVAGFLLAILFFPLHHLIEGFLRKMQYGADYKRRQALLAFSHTLPSFTNLLDLIGAFTRTVRQTLQVEHCNFYIHRKRQFHCYYPEPVLPAILTPEEAPTWTPPPPYTTIIPITFQDQLLALLLTGNRKGGIPINTEERSLLLSLSSQVGLMVHNLLLLEEAQERVVELDYLHQFHRAILDKSPVGIAVVDEEGELKTINEAGRAVLGNEEIATLLAKLGEGEGNVVIFKHKTILCYTAPMDLNRSKHTVVLFQDITENVALKEELAHQEQLALLGRVAASIAHEINTPLTGISSYAQILEAKGRIAPEHQDHLRYITRETFYLSNLVKTLLSFSKSRDVDSNATCSLHNCLTRAQEVLSPILNSHSFNLNVNPILNDLSVKGDDILFTQALINVILNACQAVDWKGRVEISVVKEEETVRCTITDNGPGFPEEILTSPGRPFVTSKGEGGTGLGLALTRSILEAYGGHLLFQTPPEGGACVILEMRHA